MFWYNNDVEAVLAKPVKRRSKKKKKVVFYGSSSFTLWCDIEKAFPDFIVSNLAFGGSTLAACAWFYKKLITKHKPDIIVLYAGDNDLGDGRHPEEVFLFFKSLIGLIQEDFDNIPIAFLSVKPTLARRHLMDSIRFTNKIISEEIALKYPQVTFVDIFSEMLDGDNLIDELYEADGLHLSTKGYKIWQNVIFNSYLKNFI